MTTASPKTSLSKSLHFLFGAGLLVSFFLPWVAWFWVLTTPFAGIMAHRYFRSLAAVMRDWWDEFHTLFKRRALKDLRTNQARLRDRLSRLSADYAALRARGDPAVFRPTDIGVRNALGGLGFDPAATIAASDRWRPWRSYALMHLWNTLMPATPAENEEH